MSPHTEQAGSQSSWGALHVYSNLRQDSRKSMTGHNSRRALSLQCGYLWRKSTEIAVRNKDQRLAVWGQKRLRAQQQHDSCRLKDVAVFLQCKVVQYLWHLLKLFKTHLPCLQVVNPPSPSPKLFLLFRNCANTKTEHPASFTAGWFKTFTTTGNELFRLIWQFMAVK